MSKPTHKEFNFSDYQRSDSLEHLKTIVPSQYVTYEVFDLAFKHLWAVVSKFELQECQECQHTNKLQELESRIQNIEELLHSLSHIQTAVPEYVLKQLNELNDSTKEFNSQIANVQHSILLCNQQLNSEVSKIVQMEDAMSILTRIVADIQNEYDQVREQADRMENDLIEIFKQFQSVLGVEQSVRKVNNEIMDIQQSIKEIYQFI